MRRGVLDHGYVQFVEAWGTGYDGGHSCQMGESDDYECGIIEAARQSTQGSFRGWDQDAKLLKHLHENKHATPFEFAGIVIEVQAPIFVFREWHRHRTQSYNEMSARYAPLPDLYYVPDPAIVAERAAKAGANKQAGTTGKVAGAGTCTMWTDTTLTTFYQMAEAYYKGALEAGIPKELARLVMPVGHYSRMRASANLRNWLAFLTLRMDPNAQWEIQQYAKAVGLIVEANFPQTWKLFKHE